jgi:hypothetical protein
MMGSSGCDKLSHPATGWSGTGIIGVSWNEKNFAMEMAKLRKSGKKSME